jgi:hypothetical protein
MKSISWNCKFILKKNLLYRFYFSDLILSRHHKNDKSLEQISTLDTNLKDYEERIREF